MMISIMIIILMIIMSNAIIRDCICIGTSSEASDQVESHMWMGDFSMPDDYPIPTVNKFNLGMSCHLVILSLHLVLAG